MEPQGPLVVSAAARARLAKWGLQQGSTRGPAQQPAAPVELQAFIVDTDTTGTEAAEHALPGQPRRLQHWLVVTAGDLRRLGAYDGSLVEAGAHTPVAMCMSHVVAQSAICT